MAWLAVATTGCRPPPPEPPLELPPFIVDYERWPFSSEQFQRLKRVIDPTADLLHASDLTFKTQNYGVAINTTPEQTSAALQAILSPQWQAAPDLSLNTQWGWSQAFRSGKNVLVFVTIKPEMVEIPEQFPMMPAAVLSNLKIQATTINPVGK